MEIIREQASHVLWIKKQNKTKKAHKPNKFAAYVSLSQALSLRNHM